MVANARNHCGAILAANLALSLGAAEPAALLAARAFDLIGPGPIMRGAARARQFVRAFGFNVTSAAAMTFGSMRRQISAGCPIAALVLLPTGGLHWILAMGTAADDGAGRFCVADGWHRDTRFLVTRSGVRFLYGAAFRLVT